MSLETWQRELRRQFGRAQRFALTNVGTEAVFSDFEVRNPQNASTYRVAIRGVQPGENYCSCPDFATNALGTCKHGEFVLGRLEWQRKTEAILQRDLCEGGDIQQRAARGPQQHVERGGDRWG